MTKFFVALLGLAAIGFGGPASAQTPVARIAYDVCYAYDWEVVCDIEVLGAVAGAAGGVGPKWSPDGSRVLFIGSTYDNSGEILVVNLADGNISNLTNHPANDSSPAWSRDGTKIAFASHRDGLPELYVMNVDGSNPTRLTDHVGFNRQPVWSPDSGRIAFGCEIVSGNGDICTVNADGTDLVRLTTDPAWDEGAAFSPADGTIAFATGRFGGEEIVVLEADGAVRRVSADTVGSQPAWSPDGSRLAFTNGWDIFVVPAAGGSPVNLTNDGQGYYSPGWSPDGSQLVFGGTATVGYSGICYFGEGAHNADDFCMPMSGIYVVNADGTGLSLIATGGNPDWFIPAPGHPLASFTYHCSGSSCDFDGSGSSDSDGTIASYAWQFGDGSSGSGPIVNHTYAIGDHYIVKLTVTDDAGTTDFVSVNVEANAPPVASFTAACSGNTCNFDASGSTDPDGTITHYAWSFGDGQGSGSATTTHAYPTGTFTVTLHVWDNGGAMAVQTKSVSAVNASPVAAFTHACASVTCNFDGSGSSDPDGTVTNYWWTFGDGGVGWGAIATHAYAAGGAYTVTLTVADNSGTTTVLTKTVSVVNAAPVAAFSEACTWLTCTFNGSGSSDPDGTIATYSWVFGDGTTGSGAIVTHAYATTGSYNVTLTVRDNGGATTTQTKSLTVIQSMHVGDLDIVGASHQTDWTAFVTVTVHDAGHSPLAGATVSGSWGNGLAGSCTTDGSGRCTLANAAIPKKIGSMTFTVVNVAHATASYQSVGNHDPDGDSDGTSVRVSKP